MQVPRARGLRPQHAHKTIPGELTHDSVVEHAGRPDDVGREFHSTQVHMADQLASAAELVLGPSGGVPAAIVRGVVLEAGDEGATGGLIDRDRDLFA